jgi:hypothetical protein
MMLHRFTQALDNVSILSCLLLGFNNYNTYWHLKCLELQSEYILSLDKVGRGILSNATSSGNPLGCGSAREVHDVRNSPIFFYENIMMI